MTLSFLIEQLGECQNGEMRNRFEGVWSHEGFWSCQFGDAKQAVGYPSLEFRVHFDSDRIDLGVYFMAVILDEITQYSLQRENGKGLNPGAGKY